MRLLIGLRPAQADDLGQQPLAESAWRRKVRSAAARPASVRLSWRDSGSTASRPSRTRRVTISRHRRGAHPEPLRQARGDDRLPLAVHVADRHEVLGRGLGRLTAGDRLRHGADSSRGPPPDTPGADDRPRRRPAARRARASRPAPTTSPVMPSIPSRYASSGIPKRASAAEVREELVEMRQARPRPARARSPAGGGQRSGRTARGRP